MPKRLSKNKNIRDMNVLAASIVDQITGEPIPKNVLQEQTKNQAAVSLDRLGGLKNAKALMEKLTPEKRKEIAQKAAKIRWGKI